MNLAIRVPATKKNNRNFKAPQFPSQCYPIAVLAAQQQLSLLNDRSQIRCILKKTEPTPSTFTALGLKCGQTTL